MPPPWMSNSSPSQRRAIAEHSRCQPGRPGAEGRRPRRALGLVGLVALPEGEVARVALAARVGVVGARHVVERLARQRAVLGPRAHVEVHVAAAVGGGIRVALLDERLHERDHVGHVTGGARLVGGRLDAERVERLRGEALVAVGQGEPVLARLGRLAQHLVVDVGDVAHERDVVAVTDLEPAAQHVEGDGETDVADVRRTLRREPTDVHADLARLARREVAQLPGRGVEQS